MELFGGGRNDIDYSIDNISAIDNVINTINDGTNDNVEDIHDFFDIKSFNTDKYDTQSLDKRLSPMIKQLSTQQIKTLYRYCNDNGFETDDQKIMLLRELRKRQQPRKKESDNPEDSANIRFENALVNIRDGNNISDILVDAIDDDNQKLIIKTIYDYIDKGIDLSEGIDLQGKFFINEDISTTIRDKNYILSLNEITEILGNEQSDFFRNIGQRYLENITNKIQYTITSKGISADTLCEQLGYPENEGLYNIYSQYLLFMSKYGDKILSPTRRNNKENQSDHSEIKKRFKATLNRLGYKVSNVDQSALQEEEERQNRIEEENKQRVKAALERTKKRNETNNIFNKRREKHEEVKPKSINANESTGTEIAIASKLDLSGVKIERNHKFDEINREMIKYPAFDMAWNHYISSAGKITINGEDVEIKSLITSKSMRQIYDINTESINEDVLKDILYDIYKKPDGSPNITKDDFDAIKNQLQGFTTYFHDSIKKLSNKSGEMKNQIENTVKTHAIGRVIDNIRGIMTEVGQDEKDGFKFTQEPPVKIEGNYLILPGEINGTKIDIRYNIKTGELFINSLLNRLGGDKIIIGEKGNYEKVGGLGNFNNILAEYYKPQPVNTNNIMGNIKSQSAIRGFSQTENINSKENSIHNANNSQFMESQRKKQEQGKENFKNTLNQEINLIGQDVRKKFKKQELTNSVITKFMKTFNIIPDTGDYKNIEIKEEKDCRLFNLIQAISTSDSGQLTEFRSLVKEITEFAGLKPGKNCLPPKTGELYKKEYFNGIKKDIQDGMLAYTNGEMIKLGDEKILFNADFKSSIIDTIMKYSLSGEFPNQKIDINKIQESFKALSLDDISNESNDEISIPDDIRL